MVRRAACFVKNMLNKGDIFLAEVRYRALLK